MGKQTADNRTRPAGEGQVKTSPPPMFKVLMHNDDYTTMEFVVEVLMSIFQKSETEANRIMLHIHYRGVGVCGIYPFEIAETKIAKVHNLARAEGHPLRCSMDQA